MAVEKVFSFGSWDSDHPSDRHPGERIDAQFDAHANAIRALERRIDALVRADGKLHDNVLPFAAPVLLSGGNAATLSEAAPEDWAEVSMEWAEHMPDVIPGNILATNAITGDHWSSRWWANQAARIAARGTVTLIKLKHFPFDGVATTFPLLDETSAPIVPATNVSQLTISVEGVIQEPGVDFVLALAGASVTFTTPPAADARNFATYALQGTTSAAVIATATVSFPTRTAAAAALLPPETQAIATSGYLNPGDGGGAVYYEVGGSTLGGFQSADGQWWALAGGSVNVKQYGAVGDGVADDTAAIQAAVDVRGAAGGGVVTVPTGRFKITQTINVNYPGVQLVGAGRDMHHTDTPSWPHRDNTASITSLEWAGAAGGTMISITAPAGSTSSIGGNGVRQMNLIGSLFPHTANVAAVGLRIEAGMAGQYDVFTQEFSEAGVLVVGKAGMGVGEGCAIFNRFTYVGGRQFSTNGAILKMTGIANVGDGYNNVFDMVEGVHLNGTGIDLYCEDSCKFEFVRLTRGAGGTGKGVVCHAYSSAQIPSSSNWFVWMYCGGGGFYVNGTEENVFPSINNYIELFNTDENSTPQAPFLGIGAECDWHPQRAHRRAGRQPYAYAIGFSPGLTITGTSALAAVAAGLGGAIAIPVAVNGLLRLERVALWSMDTANLRTAEFGIYIDQGDFTQPKLIRLRSGTFSATPAGVAGPMFSASSSLYPLGPGIYWLVIRNTSAAQTFGIGSVSAGTFARSNNRRHAGIAALGPVIDIGTAAGWTGDTSLAAVRFDGRVAAEGTAFGREAGEEAYVISEQDPRARQIA